MAGGVESQGRCCRLPPCVPIDVAPSVHIRTRQRTFLSLAQDVWEEIGSAARIIALMRPRHVPVTQTPPPAAARSVTVSASRSPVVVMAAAKKIKKNFSAIKRDELSEARNERNRSRKSAIGTRMKKASAAAASHPHQPKRLPGWWSSGHPSRDGCPWRACRPHRLLSRLSPRTAGLCDDRAAVRCRVCV